MPDDKKHSDDSSPAGGSQSPWRDDEMDRVSTESCRIAPSWKTDSDELRAVIGDCWTIVQQVNLVDDAERRGKRLARTPDIGVDRRTIAESLLVMNALVRR